VKREREREREGVGGNQIGGRDIHKIRKIRIGIGIIR
jgi:hypothetical protein